MNNEMLIKAIIAATILIILTVLWLKRYVSKETKKTILLMGACDAGKTSLYTLLRFDENRPTVSSMKENEGSLIVSGKTLDLVDLPGHERVRFRFLDFLPVARCIVFMIDSTTINRQIRPVSEYLYDILVKVQGQYQFMPLLIACNKSDLITALPIEKIKPMLESELNRLRATRTARVEQSEEEDSFIGYEGEDFNFKQLENETTFVPCSVKNKNIKEVQNWIKGCFLVNT
ncbi:signal recognition particle receptor beta subunit-domain-containing protein [Sporodiniella umbellata]|nr:signal recognition particle receptor beta subunit-domain-containing protein [Sporodiniella umbellata]